MAGCLTFFNGVQTVCLLLSRSEETVACDSMAKSKQAVTLQASSIFPDRGTIIVLYPEADLSVPAVAGILVGLPMNQQFTREAGSRGSLTMHNLSPELMHLKSTSHLLS